jgi:hypothetical protein
MAWLRCFFYVVPFAPFPHTHTKEIEINSAFAATNCLLTSDL